MRAGRAGPGNLGPCTPLQYTEAMTVYMYDSGILKMSLKLLKVVANDTFR